MTLRAQSNDAALKVVRDFVQAQERLPRERIYVHTDRDWYMTEDRIWFSAYVTAGGYNYLSEISELMYVELVNEEGDVIHRHQVKLTEGRGEGTISLRDLLSLNEGSYELRAYTKWALNFGDSYIFKKQLLLVGESVFKDAEQNSGVADLQFLPEGGHMIGGIPNRIAFKAIGTDGLSRETEGSIIDDLNNTITTFSTQYKGMGSFTLEPDTDREYFAVVGDTRYPLPQSLTEGINIEGAADAENLRINVRSTASFRGQRLLLLAHVRGVVYHAEQIILNDQSSEITMPTEKLASGIVQVSLLNEEGRPVAERLLFNKNPANELNLEFELESDVIGLRKELGLKMELQSALDSLPLASASVTAFEDGLFDYDTGATNIKTAFFLESELKGHVEDPAFYFGDDPKAGDYLDLLMLTQGWRAYDLTDFPTRFDETTMDAPERGMKISGWVKRPFFGKYVEDANVWVSIGLANESVHVVKTDQDGRFEISDLEFTGQETVTIKATDKNGKDRLIAVLNEQFEDFPHSYDMDMPIRSTYVGKFGIGDPSERKGWNEAEVRSLATQEYLDELIYADMVGELEEITITAERRSEDPWLRMQRRFERVNGSMDEDLDLMERPDLWDNNMSQILNRIPGVIVVGGEIRVMNSARYGRRNESNTAALNLGNISVRTRSESAQVIVNGVRYYDSDIVLSLKPSDIQTIQVYRSQSFLEGNSGSRGRWSLDPEYDDIGIENYNRGTIRVTTRPGIEVGETTRNMDRIVIAGYQPQADFYAPKYGVKVPPDLEQPDERITLFWDPKLDFENGRTELRFWTNDVSSRYRIVVEGITDAGIPFTATRTFTTSELTSNY